MRKFSALPVLVLIAMVTISCNNTKQSSKNKVAVSNVEPDESINQLSNNGKYRLTVSFYSKGAGTDRVNRPKFEGFIAAYSPKLSYEEAHWGREGEVDYCFNLSELSTAKQDEFVKQVREMLANSELVHINENAECVHKR